ncbi:ankyrin repeat family, partial, partial [Olea europaea subsp. europaea]
SQCGHILNIGFGMELVDIAIQQYAPISPTIVEAHGEMENVKIVFGFWQNVLSQLEPHDFHSNVNMSAISILLMNLSSLNSELFT